MRGVIFFSIYAIFVLFFFAIGVWNGSRILSHDYFFRSKINMYPGWLDNDGLMVVLVVVVVWKENEERVMKVDGWLDVNASGCDMVRQKCRGKKWEGTTNVVCSIAYDVSSCDVCRAIIQMLEIKCVPCPPSVQVELLWVNKRLWLNAADKRQNIQWN